MKTLPTFRIILTLILSILSHTTQSQTTSPVAGFQLSTNSGCIPFSISVTNTSLNSTQYEWNFGNGVTSTATQPAVMYSTSGIFDITLVAKDGLGNSDTLTLTNAVTANSLPTANFNFNVINACLNQNLITFSNLSTSGLNYTWDFGDGNSSLLENPTHSYSDSGSYLVSLMVSDSIGCSNFKQANQTIRIAKNQKLQYTVSDSVGCDTSQIFSFNCTTDSITSWRWSFGDGDSAMGKNHSHRYTNPGVYDIQLITMNQFGCPDTLIKRDQITVQNKTSLNFNSSTNSGCKPLAVNFYPNANNQLSTFQWNLGDGRKLYGDSISTTFDSSGTYSITLISTTNNGCVDSIVKPSFINVIGNTVASFSVDSTTLCKNTAIQFINITTYSKSCTFLWDFGDNNTSTNKNPNHIFQDYGTYTIQLTAIDSNGCTSNFSRSLEIKEATAGFTSIESMGCKPLTVSFRDLSSTASSWLWDFGDGDTSHQKNPIHTYQSSGKFSVSLTIKSLTGCVDSVTHNDFISVFNDTISENLSDTISGCLPLPIDFSDNNLGETEWIWDFGNGDTSMVKAPTYTYKDPGTYTVTLKTFSSNGCPIFIKNYSTFIIDSITPRVSTLGFDCQNRTIQLTDSTKNITSWHWAFGDGSYSTLQSPIHQFSDTLIYSISLTVINDKGCTQSVYFPNYIDFSNCLVGGKTPSPGKGGAGLPSGADTTNSTTFFIQNCAPQIVQLSNPDTNAFSWHWEFGDGDSSTIENPIHTYRTPGTYNVRLITHNSTGLDTIIWNNHITVNGPIADFSTTNTHGCDSVSITANNTSQGVNFWTWKFDNKLDSNSHVINQTVPYSNRNHPILLKVSDSSGCSASKIRILNFPKNDFSFHLPDSACVGDSLTFTANNPSATYNWFFGDGTTDSSLSPSHVYTQAGVYPIHVISKSSNGCERIHLLDSIRINGANAQFLITDSVNCKNEPFSFAPKDVNADTYFWTFDSILSSNIQSPTLHLDKAGKYTINLSVTKDGCQNSYTHPTAVTVKDVAADFKITQLNNCYPIQVSVEDTNSNSSNWSWRIDSTQIKNLNQYTFTTIDSTTNISLQVTAKNGCTDSISKVFIPSVLSSAFEISDSVGCAPLSVSFNNKSSNASSSYWSFGDGDTSTAKNPTHIYKKGGVYSVQLINSTMDGCSDTTIVQRLIHVSSITANYTTSFNSTCAPMMVSFSDSSDNATSWKWRFGDGTTSIAKNPLKIYNQPGVFDVSLEVSNSKGCRDTLVVEKQIVVPGPITNFSASDSIVCGVNPIQFIDSSINATQWNWFFGDGHTSNQQNPQHTYTTPGKYSVVLMTLDSAGCGGLFTLPKAIRMNHKPLANFNIKDSIGCTPFQVNFKTDSSEVIKWRWDMGNGIVISDSVANYTFNNPGTYSISLTLENEAGCIDSTQFDSLKVLKTPNSKITPITPLCSNEEPILLQAKDSGGIWFGKGISDPLIGKYNPNNASGLIDTITYTISGVCSSSDTLEIEIKEAPEVDFNVSQLEGCKELEVKFESILLKELTDKSAITYIWQQNGVCFGNSSLVSNTFKPGLFDINLQVKTRNGCSDEINKPELIKVFDTIPSNTTLNRVTVLNDHEVLIEWQKNVDIAFSHHILYRKSSLDSSFSAIKTFKNQDEIFFVDKNLNTIDLIYCYKIVSVDKCGQQLKLYEVPFHCTINVASKKLSENSIKVEWSRYEGSPVDYYEVYRQDKTSNTNQLIATVTSTTLELIDTSAYCNYEYSYKVKANGPRGLLEGSMSDTSQVKMDGISHLQKSEIIRATVEGNSSVLIEWTPVNVAPDFATGYVIHRSLDNKNFSPLTYLPIDKTNYNDSRTSVNEERYFYQIEVINTCLTKNEISDIGSSILLNSVQIDNFSGKIDWTNYQKWSSGIKHYEIQRLNKFNQWETIQIVPESIQEWIINY